MEVTLVSRYFDTRNQGIGSYSKLIYDALKLKGLKVNTISVDNKLLPFNFPLHYQFWILVELRLLLSKKKYKNSDVFHSLNPLESLYLPKHKSVASILDFIPFTMLDSVDHRLHAKIFRKSIYSSIQCEKIVVLNSDIKRILISDYGVEESSIEIIPPAIDNKFNPMNKKNDDYVIGTVSNLARRKRVDILINSFLKADIENSKLLIGGTGPQLDNLKKISNDNERIEFLGFIPDEKMNDFYNSLDVFVFPTLSEGYGMPIVEAMACGKPVITMDDSDIPSNIKEKTAVCTKRNLHEVLSNKNYNCNIKNNLKFANLHSIENIGRKLVNVYNSI